jgi:vesicle transport through interaction with t-SNAREs protein 1
MSAPLSRVFEGYDEEFQDLTANVGRLVVRLRDETGGAEHRRGTQAEAEREMAKVEETVQQMELEARSGGKGSEARELQAMAKARRAELGALRNSLRQAAASVHSRDREQLMGESSGDEGSNDRARLLAIGEKMEAGTRKLQDAHRTLLETEAVGESTLSDLHSQRETLTHAAGTLQRANEGLNRSKRVLSAMGRRALGNRLLMWCMIMLLAGMILLVLWLQVFGFGGSDASGSHRPNTTRSKVHGGL